jgi:hypothetical protein
MKGISLPIEMIIVISISVIALLTIVFFFGAGFTKGAASISDTDAWNRACGMIKSRGCHINEDLSSITIPRYMIGENQEGTARDACLNSLGYGRLYLEDDKCVSACCGTSTATVGR